MFYFHPFCSILLLHATVFLLYFFVIFCFVVYCFVLFSSVFCYMLFILFYFVSFYSVLCIFSIPFCLLCSIFVCSICYVRPQSRGIRNGEPG